MPFNLSCSILPSASDEQILVAANGKHKHAANLHGQERGGDQREEEPDDKGVPLPLPKQVNQLQGVTMAEMEDGGAGQRQLVRVEKHDAEVHEGQKQQPLQGGNGVNADLGGDLVEPAQPGDQEHGDGGEAQKRADADDDGDGQTPTQTFWTDPTFQQAQQGPENAAAEAVADVPKRCDHTPLECGETDFVACGVRIWVWEHRRIAGTAL